MGIGNEFFGIFSASNAADGTQTAFFNDMSSLFQRDFTGTVGTGSFQLKNARGGNVAFSIDPFFFSGTSSDIPAVPEPGSLVLLVTSLVGLAELRRRTSQ